MGSDRYSSGRKSSDKSGLKHSMEELGIKTMKDKNSKKQPKRLSKGQRTHIRRLKQAEGKDPNVAKAKK
jgi:hypothetical protein